MFCRVEDKVQQRLHLSGHVEKRMLDMHLEPRKRDEEGCTKI